MFNEPLQGRQKGKAVKDGWAAAGTAGSSQYSLPRPRSKPRHYTRGSARACALTSSNTYAPLRLLRCTHASDIHLRASCAASIYTILLHLHSRRRTTCRNQTSTTAHNTGTAVDTTTFPPSWWVHQEPRLFLTRASEANSRSRHRGTAYLHPSPWLDEYLKA